MLRPANIGALGAWLREHDFPISTHQLIAAARLVAGSRDLGPKETLGPYLAPIFCSDAAQQARFPDLYDEWVRMDPTRRPDGGAKTGTEDRRALPARTRCGAGWAVAVAVMLSLAGAAAWYGLEQHVDVRVENEEGQTLAGARVRGEEPGVDLNTDAGGIARLAFHRWHLKLHLKASHPDYLEQSAVIEDTRTPKLTLKLARPPKPLPAVPQTAPFGRRVAAVAAPPRTQGPAVPRPGGLRIDPAALALQALMLATVGAWWLFAALRRRGFLERLPGSDTDITRPLRACGPTALDGLSSDVRHLGRELRRRREIPSRALDVRATIAANLRRVGPIQLVFGTRAEPEYLVLVDRAGPRDHQTRLADEVIRALLAQGVSLDRYEFDADPRCCLHRPLGTSAMHHGPQSLEQLRVRHPDAKLILFCDGRGLIDRYTGQPTPWLADLFQWPTPAMVTPQPRRLWSAREWRLRQAGLYVLPIDGDGLRALGHVFHGDAALPVPDEGARDRARPAYLRDFDVLLDRHAPDAPTIERLLHDLERDLGADGMSWLAGVGVYPELHWDITLTVGDGLLARGDAARSARPIADLNRHAQLLAQLSRLPWLRWGYMPDWLRDALLRRLTPAGEKAVRETLEALLETVDEDKDTSSGSALQVAVPAPRTSWGDAVSGLRALLRRKPASDAAEDRVFLRFMSGPRPRLAVDASDRLMDLLYHEGAPLAGPRLLPLVVVAATCVGIAWLAPPLVRGVVLVPAPVVAPAPTALALNADGSLIALEDDSGQLRVQMEGGPETPVCASWSIAADAIQFSEGSLMAITRTGSTRLQVSATRTNGTCSLQSAGVVEGSVSTIVSGLQPRPVDTPIDASIGCVVSDGKAIQRLFNFQFANLIGRAPSAVPCATSANSQRIGILAADNGLFTLPRGAAAAVARAESALPAGSAPQALAVSADGRTAAVVRADGSVWVMKGGAWRSLGLLQARPPLAMTGDGNGLAFSDQNREVQIWSLDKVASSNVLLSIVSDNGPGRTTQYAAAASTRVGDALAQRYGFSKRVNLPNPGAADVLQALKEFGSTLTPEDRLVIAYAGSADSGGWTLRAIAPGSGRANLPREQLAAAIDAIPAREVLVIADSPAPAPLTDGPAKASGSRARWVLGSAAADPTDAQAFSIAVANSLRTATQPMTGAALFQSARQRFQATDRSIDGMSYQRWPAAGHAAGDVLLKPAGPAQPELSMPSLSVTPIPPTTITSSHGDNADTSLSTTSKQAPVSQKATLAMDVFFDFDKATLRPEAKAKFDELVALMAPINLEVVIAVGHVDSNSGSDAYAQKLSVREAEAVKAYLVSKGIDPNRIYTEGKGNKQPIADNKTAAGRARNRRVEIEVVGTRTVAPPASAK